MTPIQRITEALKSGDFTGKQLQQMTGANNIYVLLNYLIKKNKIKKEKIQKPPELPGRKTVYIYSLITETANQDA